MKSTSVLVAAALLGVACLSTSQAQAAPVRVVVHLPQPSGPPSVPGYVCVENGVLPVVPPRRDPRREALLFLEPVEPAAPTEPATAKSSSATSKKGATVRIFGMRFQPEIVAATDGTPVVFRNEDRLPVTLVSSEAPRLFPATPLQPGATLSVSIPAGMSSLSVRVLEHPQMRATLLLPKGPWRHLKWSPGGDMGLAELDLPAGIYVARLFFAHHYVASQPLTVPADDAAPEKGARPAVSGEATEIILRAETASPVAGRASASPSPSALPDPSPAPAGAVE